jgi:hypothetical protein
VLKSTARFIVVAALASATLFLPAAPAGAHEHREVGDIVMTVGWADEPTFAGYLNAVGLNLNEHGTGGEEEGPPISDAEVEVEVLFGDENSDESTGPLPVEESFGEPGFFQAPLIPSRPGTYTFHFTGTVGRQEIDEFFTSGPETFNDAQTPADIQFPAQDPTTGELAQALEQSRADNTELVAQVEDAESAASSARTLAMVGIIAGALGVIVAAIALARRRSAA